MRVNLNSSKIARDKREIRRVREPVGEKVYRNFKGQPAFDGFKIFVLVSEAQTIP